MLNGPDPVQRVIPLPVGRCLVYSTHIETVYPPPDDGWPAAVSDSRPPITDPEFRACAVLFGYRDTARDVLLYGIERDLTHHLVACLLGASYSRVIWAEAHNCRLRYDVEDESRPWPWRCSDEEHCVNNLLMYAWHGKEDEEYGVLRSLWEDALPCVGEWTRWWLRPHRYSVPVGLFPMPYCTPWPDKRPV